MNRTRSRVLRTTVVLLLVACTLWAYLAVKPVRAQALEYQWLSAHGQRETDPVLELGWQQPSGAAKSVIVRSRTGIEAFVDLEGSKHVVRAVGATVPVVLDQRLSPAVGTGTAADLVNRSFVSDYAQAIAWPAGGALVVLLAAGIWTMRRRRQPVAVPASPQP